MTPSGRDADHMLETDDVDGAAGESLEDEERNPELLAAEKDVDRMSAFTPLVNPPIE
ncbi:MAG: hypothetical protein ACYCXY_09095 [Acidimicrobiales bacterium]